MRSICFKTMALAWIVASLAASVATGRAQSYQFVTNDTKWRFNQKGVDLGTGWRATTYDDTIPSWEGPGNTLFGYETTPAEYLPLTFRTTFVDPLTVIPEVNTYYFRTHFTMPSAAPAYLAGTSLISSNWVDDGSVIYLNGTEIGRVRIAAGAVTFGTFAASAPEPTISIIVLTNKSRSHHPPNCWKSMRCRPDMLER